MQLKLLQGWAVHFQLEPEGRGPWGQGPWVHHPWVLWVRRRPRVTLVGDAVQVRAAEDLGDQVEVPLVHGEVPRPYGVAQGEVQV